MSKCDFRMGRLSFVCSPSFMEWEGRFGYVLVVKIWRTRRYYNWEFRRLKTKAGNPVKGKARTLEKAAEAICRRWNSESRKIVE